MYCIKCLMFTKNKNIKLKYKTNRKVNLIVAVLTVVLKALKLLIKKN